MPSDFILINSFAVGLRVIYRGLLAAALLSGPVGAADVAASTDSLEDWVQAARLAAKRPVSDQVCRLELNWDNNGVEKGEIMFTSAQDKNRALKVRWDRQKSGPGKECEVSEGTRSFDLSSALLNTTGVEGTAQSFASYAKLKYDRQHWVLSFDPERDKPMWRVDYQCRGDILGTLYLFPKYGAFASYQSATGNSGTSVLERMRLELGSALPGLATVSGPKTNWQFEPYHDRAEAAVEDVPLRDVFQTVLKSSQNQGQHDFLELMLPLSVRLYRDFGVPPSATVAMAAYESNYGRSRLAAEHYNFFGIKAQTEKWNRDKALLMTHDEGVARLAWFRSYTDFLSGVRGYGEFLIENTRYYRAFQAHSGTDFVQSVLQAGYCPDQDYLENINTLICRHRLDVLDRLLMKEAFAARSSVAMNTVDGSSN